MRNEKMKDFKSEGHHRGERYRGRDRSQQHGPKTFRRGRAIAFLERLNLKRSTIMEQLDKPEFQSITQVLAGELKAIDMVINEFTQLFEINESEITDLPDNNEKVEDSVSATKEFLDNSEEGNELNETD
ncbi:hypothetical protein ACFVR1_07710 [Psychrobacillus sp. NPDC058041]|uniref:hypothetical protein n=1 Tax=Psychrobacillus sp. NPDC058041 TaxID=3346310 RepID=UPI0036D94F47